MSLYQGRAIGRVEPARRAGAWWKRVVRFLSAGALAVGVAHLPWQLAADRIWVLTDARVEGHHYLDPDQVLAVAGIQTGQSLFDLDPARARQALMLHPRIEDAQVTWYWPRGVRIQVTERLPVLLVHHGLPWEMDSTGTLLEPLARGVVADAPLLSGAGFEGLPSGARVATAAVRRGLAWARILGVPELQLAGETSEIDVSSSRATVLILLDGTRVLAPAWPGGIRDLSALRVVLADLRRRGSAAGELDVRFEDQVIVRPSGAKLPESASRGEKERLGLPDSAD